MRIHAQGQSAKRSASSSSVRCSRKEAPELPSRKDLHRMQDSTVIQALTPLGTLHSPECKATPIGIAARCSFPRRKLAQLAPKMWHKGLHRPTRRTALCPTCRQLGVNRAEA